MSLQSFVCSVDGWVMILEFTSVGPREILFYLITVSLCSKSMSERTSTRWHRQAQRKQKNNPAVQVKSAPKRSVWVCSYSVSDEDSWQLSTLLSGPTASRSNNTFISVLTEATISPCLHYEILQLPLEEDDEFFGGLCGGLKDLERLRLLALLPPPLPPEAALLATE